MPAIRRNTHLADDHGVVFESTDPGRTEAFLADAFGTPTKINGDRDNYGFWLARLCMRPFQLNTVDHRANVEFIVDPLPSDVAVVRMQRGVRTNRDNDERFGPGDISVYAQPGAQSRLRVTSARFSSAVVPMEAVAEAARNRPDDDLGPLRFDSLRPVDPGAARRWLAAVEYVTSSVRADPAAMSQPLLAGAATRLLAATLLATFPNTWTLPPSRDDHTDATTSTVARAMAFIDNNADLDIGVVDIARAAYASVRAVQLGFRRHVGTTPMAYLRRVRLERIHEELRAASPGDGTTVSQVAARWGFADPSRFTALYRRTYGQPPSQTLRG